MINESLLVFVNVTHLNESSAFRRRKKRKKNKSFNNFKSVKKKQKTNMKISFIFINQLD